MKKLLTVMGGAILMFGFAFTASAQAAPKVDSVNIEKNGNSYELTITASGYVAESAHFDGVLFGITPEPEAVNLEGFNLGSLSLCHGASDEPYAQSAYCLGDGTDSTYGTDGFYPGTGAHNGQAAFNALGANDISFAVTGPDSGTVTWTITFGSAFIRANAGTEFTISNIHLWEGPQLTSLEGSALGNDVTQTVLADVGISVSPTAGTIALDAGEDFVLTVQATGADADLVTALEIDHSMEGTLPEFALYADSDNPYGTNTSGSAKSFTIGGTTVSVDAGASEESVYNALGVDVVYANNTWTITFESAKPVFKAIKANSGITFYLVLKNENGDLFGSMDPTTPENTFAYTFEANPTNVLSLSGFSNQTMRVGDTRTFNGSLNLQNWSGTSFTGLFTVAANSVDGLTVTTTHPVNGVIDMTDDLVSRYTENYGFGPEYGWTGSPEAGDNTSIALDITIRATKPGSYTFTVSDNDGNFDDQTFTLTVNPRSTGSSGGGGGGSRPSTSTTVDTTTTIGDALVIDGVSYDLNNLTPAQEEAVVVHFQKQIVALLQQIIALIIAQQ